MKQITCCKCIGIFFFLVLLVLFCNGCENKKIKQIKTAAYPWPKDDSVSYSVGNIAVSGERMVYVQNDILHIRDLTTGNDTVLCSRPDCKHQEDDSSCEAAAPAEAFGSGFEAIGVHGDVVFEVVTSKDMKSLIYLSKIGENKRAKVAELSVDGKLLYNLNDNKSEDYEKCRVNNYVYDIKEQKLYEASERKSKDYNAMMIWCDKLIAYDAKDASIVDIPLSEYVTEVKK